MSIIIPRHPLFFFFFFIFLSVSLLFFCRDKDKIQSRARIRAKKNEPLSTHGKRVVYVMDQGSLAAPAATVIRPTRVASSVTSVEEITPLRKKVREVDKGKEKASLRSSSVWDDADLT